MRALYRQLICGAAALPLITFAVTGFSPCNSTLRPGEVWLDDRGEPINAHGGGFLYEHGIYYWFGEARTARGNKGVSCYSSRDLYNWKNEGTALALADEASSPISAGNIIERPKVIYNRQTGKYAMWFHNELRGRGYSAAQTGVAVSEKVTGPYRL